jgi:hypothetical protein
MSLAVHDQRIDAAADVVDAGVARDRRQASVRIDLDLADRAAVREHRIVHLVGRGRPRGRPSTRRQREPRALLGELEEIEAAVAVGDENRPSLKSTLSARCSDQRARSSCPCRSGRHALEITVAAWRIERPECEPPPTLTMSVSPMMMLTLDRHASRSATTCAKLVSWPWPLGWVPITTSTGLRLHVISVRSFGAPIEDST